MSNKKNRIKKTIHIEYTRIYNEVLKYEEVMDIDIDCIYQTFLKVLSELRSIKNLNNPPRQKDIDYIINILLTRLGV